MGAEVEFNWSIGEDQSEHLRGEWTIQAGFEEPDAGSGIWGGWFLVEARGPLGRIMDREEWVLTFGYASLVAVEERAEDLARAIKDEGQLD